MKPQKIGSNESVCQTIDVGRRGALCKIAIGVGVLAGYSILPEQWTKPIIGQIVLPAHAATSGSVLHDPCTVTLLEGDESSDTVKVRVDGYVTPPAANLPVWIFANANADIGAVELETKTDAEGNYTLTFDISGGPGLTSVSVETRARGAEGVAHCAVHFSQGVNGNFSGTMTPLETGITRSQPAEALAKLGDSIVDFFIADAEATWAPGDVCVNVSGNNVVVYMAGHPGPETGTLAAGVTFTSGSYSWKLTFLEVSQEKLKISVECTAIPYYVEGWLYPTTDSCNVPS